MIFDIDGIDDSEPFVPRKAFRTRANDEINKALHKREENEKKLREYLEYVKRDVFEVIRRLTSNIEKDNYKIEEMNFLNDRIIRLNDEEKNQNGQRKKI